MAESTKTSPGRGRLVLGGVLLALSIVPWIVAPFMPLLGLPAEQLATVIAALLIGAEIIFALSIAVLGKEAYARIKQRWRRSKNAPRATTDQSMSTGPLYDRIGHGYAELRREDPRIAERILRALGGARSVINVGAGAGSYEPTVPLVVAVEPSQIMVSQRAASRSKVIRALAQSLPFGDGSVDAAMSVLSMHHWTPHAEAGVREMRRVARERVVILTVDAEVSAEMWLMAEYLPEVAALDRRIFPPIDEICGWLGGGAEVVVVPVPADTCDWTLMSFWAHPERVLDADARAATSGFARMTPQVVARVVEAVGADLQSGAWDDRHAELRRSKEFDAGLRLLIG